MWFGDFYDHIYVISHSVFLHCVVISAAEWFSLTFQSSVVFPLVRMPSHWNREFILCFLALRVKMSCVSVRISELHFLRCLHSNICRHLNVKLAKSLITILKWLPQVPRLSYGALALRGYFCLTQVLNTIKSKWEPFLCCQPYFSHQLINVR